MGIGSVQPQPSSRLPSLVFGWSGTSAMAAVLTTASETTIIQRRMGLSRQTGAHQTGRTAFDSLTRATTGRLDGT